MPTTITDMGAPSRGHAHDPAHLARRGRLPGRLADRQIPCACLTSVGLEGFDTSIRGAVPAPVPYAPRLGGRCAGPQSPVPEVTPIERMTGIRSVGGPSAALAW